MYVSGDSFSFWMTDGFDTSDNFAAVTLIISSCHVMHASREKGCVTNRRYYNGERHRMTTIQLMSLKEQAYKANKWNSV